jgi:hypothetical protein
MSDIVFDSIWRVNVLFQEESISASFFQAVVHNNRVGADHDQNGRCGKYQYQQSGAVCPAETGGGDC